MLTHVEFRSQLFPPCEGEEDQIHPGCYGKRLAEYLRQELQNKGFDCAEPIAEDWGWLIPVTNPSFRLWIGCGSYAEYEDGFLCFIEPSKPVLRRFFRRIDTRAVIEKLAAEIDVILRSNAGIHSLRWWTEDEVKRG